jgi:hypothetical protein
MGKHLAAVVLAGLLTADTAAGDISIWAIWSPGAKTCPQLLTLEPIAERFLSSPTASHKVEISVMRRRRQVSMSKQVGISKAF